MAPLAIICSVVYFLACTDPVRGATSRSLLQANQDPNNGAYITVTPDKPNVDAIAITPVLPYPQSAYFCNVSGDSRLAVGAYFPLTVQVPVGVSSTVVFANISGTIPGVPGTFSTGSSASSSSSASSFPAQQTGYWVTQPDTSTIQQPGTVAVQQPGTSIVQQPGTSAVHQPVNPAVQPCTNPFLKCLGLGAAGHQHGSAAAGIPGAKHGHGCGGSSVVQQSGTSVVQQPGSALVQPGSALVQPGSTQVQQPGSAVSQQSGSSAVQQASSSQVGQGRKLLQKPAPIEYISNNGSQASAQLSILDTVEGVPNIVFTPTAAGQTAYFSGALQVAVTTSGDGFGTPYIPYQVESKLSPDCRVAVKFVAI